MKYTLKTIIETYVEIQFPISFKSAHSFMHYWDENKGIRISIGSGTIELMQSYQFATWYEGSEICTKSEVEAAFKDIQKAQKELWKP